jgi:hypothetical protein
MSEYIDDPGFDGTIESIREHYQTIDTVIDNMAHLGEKYPTLGFAGKTGWYRTCNAEAATATATDTDTDTDTDTGTGTQRDARFSKRARCTTFDRDIDYIINSQIGVDERNRELFNISSWKDPDEANAWKYCTPAPDREWYDDRDDDSNGANVSDTNDNAHPPGYEALRGFGFWVDLDLAHKDGRTALTADELTTIEQVHQRVINAVADAYSVDDTDVYGLDSGGGAYIYGPPEATLDVVDCIDDPQEREWFFDDLADRINEGPLSDEIESIIEEEDAGDLLNPDWIQNKNRQTKAPGSLHRAHDIVVTPLRDRHPDTEALTDGVDYTPTRISEFTGQDIRSLEAWADGLTTIENRDSVGPLLKTMYPEHTDDTDDWRGIVDAVVDQCRRAHEERQERRQNREDAIEELVTNEDGDGVIDRPDIDADAAGSLRSSSGLVSGTEIVTSRSKLSAAVDTIDVRDVVQDHASDRYDTSSRTHETTFDPSWRQSGSGKSCAIPSGRNNFIDNGCNAGGGPVFAYALGEGIIPGGEQAPTNSLTAEEFGEALDAMRADGYNIPVYVPEAGGEDGDEDEYEQTPLWALRNAALALGVIDSRDEFKEQETDDGDTYPGFDAATYTDVLDALDANGIEHGRDRLPTNLNLNLKRRLLRIILRVDSLIQVILPI